MTATVLSSFDRAASLQACHRQTAAGCIKITEDLARYNDVIARTRPAVLVECGTHHGRSALWFADRVDRVITVDIAPGTGRPYSRDRDVDPAVAQHPRIETVIGPSSVDPEVSAWVRDLADRAATQLRDPRCMVVLDSDHSADHVAAEITTYGPLVTPGCYLVVEDGILRWLPSSYDGNPLDAIEAGLVDDPAWRRDTDVETMFPVTMHPAGWWVRA